MENVLAGLAELMNFNTILFLFIGTLVGLIIGALPGLYGKRVL